MKAILIFVILIIIQMNEGTKMLLLSQVECPPAYAEFITHYNCSLINDDQGIPQLNVALQVNEVLDNITVHFKVLVKRGSNPIETFAVFDLDVCEVLGAEHEHFLLHTMSNQTRIDSNFPTDCPLYKDSLYTLTNYAINAIPLPPQVPELSWVILSHYYVHGQKALSFNSYGKISDNFEVDQ